MTVVDSRTPLIDTPVRGAFETNRAQARRLLTCLFLIAAGALSAIQVIGFTSTMLTPFCLLLAPAVLLTRPTLGQLVPFLLAVTGFVAFFISSQVNDLSVMDQRVLQWAAFGIYFLGFLVLAGRNVERAFSILCGLAIGTIVYFALPGGPYSGLTSLADLWKYAWAQWVTIILLYLLIQLRAALPVQILFMVGLAGFSLVENYRSHAMICMATAAVLLVGWLGAVKLARWVQVAIVALFGAGVATLVPAIAMSGIAGEAIQRKTELQANSGVPPLLAGRTESPLSITAILDRPWFGWGTADNISPEIFEKAKTTAFGLGFRPDFPIEQTWYLENGDVSLHSILLTAWAEGGLFAALLPLFLFGAALMIIWSAPRYGRWAALAVVVAIQAVWDLLFSPTSYNTLAALAVLAIVFAARHLPAGDPGLDGDDRGR